MLIASLRKVFILTTSGNQSSNNCEHVTQRKRETTILIWVSLLWPKTVAYFKPFLKSLPLVELYWVVLVLQYYLLDFRLV